MSGKGDIAAMLRGLNMIRQALVESKGKEVKHAWENSSMKTAAKQAGIKLQDSLANPQTPNVGDVVVSFDWFVITMY